MGPARGPGIGGMETGGGPGGRDGTSLASASAGTV